MFNATQRQHFRSIFRCHHMSDGLTICVNNITFVAQMPIRIDLHFDTAITKYTFGHDRHHIHAIVILTDNKRGRFIIWIRCSSPYCGDKRSLALDNITIPIVGISTLHKGDQFLIRALNNRQCIKAYQFTIMIGVTITSTRFSVCDKTHHRTRVTPDFFWFYIDCHVAFPMISDRIRDGVAGT